MGIIRASLKLWFVEVKTSPIFYFYSFERFLLHTVLYCTPHRLQVIRYTAFLF